MLISYMLQEKNITKYRLSKISGVPYSTVCDICSGKAQIEKCSAETVLRLSDALGISMEQLVRPCIDRPESFDLFRSNVCHRLKLLGDTAFIAELLENNEIRKYYKDGRYAESLYLLAMLDWLCRVCGLPVCSEYDSLRRCKLKTKIYPSSVLAAAKILKSDAPKHSAEKNAIPEFLRFNIVESEVRDIV